MIQIGQGLLGQAIFTDGTMAQYPRTYLVVSVEATRIGILNVSSTAGKEKKLLMKTNRRLVNYNPPFVKDCFVKLDSLSYISVQDIGSFKTLHNGNTLDNAELQAVLAAISRQ